MQKTIPSSDPFFLSLSLALYRFTIDGNGSSYSFAAIIEQLRMLFFEPLSFTFYFFRIFLRHGIACLKACLSPQLLQSDLIFTLSWKLIHNVTLLPYSAFSI